VGLVRGWQWCRHRICHDAFSQKPPPSAVVNSQLAPYLIEAANICAALAPRELKDAFASNYEKVKELWTDVSKKRLPEQNL
jgi:hypothetical protein